VGSLSRRLIASVYARLGAESRLQVADLAMRNFEETTYRRLAQMGFAPDGYIDVGAYHGNWTRLAHRLLGPKPTLMVEGQPSLVPALEAFAATRSDLSVAGGVLSDKSGEQVSFFEMGTGSSIFAEDDDDDPHVG
jgi:hypothetical protein